MLLIRHVLQDLGIDWHLSDLTTTIELENLSRNLQHECYRISTGNVQEWSLTYESG